MCKIIFLKKKTKNKHIVNYQSQRRRRKKKAMNDQQRWTHLAGLEEEAQNLLGWDIMKVAKSNQHELEMAISQFQLQRKEDDHKHDMDQQTRIDDEKMTIVDLRSHHTPEIRMNATINEHLLDQLIACYCASSPIPVTAASIERCLYPLRNVAKKIDI